MLGYFKASARFYRSQFNEADVQYVARKLGFFRGVVDEEPLDESTYRRHRNTILDYLGWKSFDTRAERTRAEANKGRHPTYSARIGIISSF